MVAVSEHSEAVHAFDELRSTGLLWLINTSVLHPRGFALALVYKTNETGEREPIGWKLVGDGTEAWTFGDDIDEPFALVSDLLKPRGGTSS